MECGDVGYVTCHGSAGHVPVTGWIVHLEESEACLASSLASLEKVGSKTSCKISGVDIGVIKVSTEAILVERPTGWAGPRISELPGWHICSKAWTQLADRDLHSSEAELRSDPAPAQRKGKSRIEQELSSLKHLFRSRRGPTQTDDEGEEDSEEDEAEDLEEEELLRPGATAVKSKKKRVTKVPELDLREEVAKALAGGQSASELMPLAMMALLMDDKKKKRSKRSKAQGSDSGSLLGGSSSDDSDDDRKLQARGLKAVSSLHRLQDRIQKNPRKIYTTFEKEIREELGVVPGQSWTVKDYVRKQQWGKFRGIYRCAMMDVAVYEQLRAGQTEVATAQVVQNLKAKLQSVLQGGDWSSAWLLTGLSDPTQRREFAGTKEEMAIVSGYVEALANLRKKVRESHSAAAEEEEEPASSNRK